MLWNIIAFFILTVSIYAMCSISNEMKKRVREARLSETLINLIAMLYLLGVSCLSFHIATGEILECLT